MLFDEEIKKIIACEGAERKERHEKLDKWFMRLDSCGFDNVPLSYYGMLQARRFLQSYGCEGYRQWRNWGTQNTLSFSLNQQSKSSPDNHHTTAGQPLRPLTCHLLLHPSPADASSWTPPSSVLSPSLSTNPNLGNVKIEIECISLQIWFFFDDCMFFNWLPSVFHMLLLNLVDYIKRMSV